MSEDMDQPIQTEIKDIPGVTGKSVQEWFQILAEKDLESHPEMTKLLMESYGLAENYADVIALLYRMQASDSSLQSVQRVQPPAEDYDSKKAALLPLFTAILHEAQKLGDDIETIPKKTHVILMRNKPFAFIVPSRKERLTLCLSLKGINATPRLIGASHFNGVCTHLIRLNGLSDFDDEVKGWLHKAYEQSGSAFTM